MMGIRAVYRKDLEEYLIRHKNEVFYTLADIGTQDAHLQFEPADTIPLTSSYAREVLEKVNDNVGRLLSTERPIPSCTMYSLENCFSVAAKSMIVPLTGGLSARAVATEFLNIPFISPYDVGLATMIGIVGITAIVSGYAQYKIMKETNSSFYTPGEITLTSGLMQSDAYGTLAHEIAHHYQQQTPVYKSMIAEGHARGVELTIAQKMSEQLGLVVLQNPMRRAASELKAACIYLREDLHQDVYGQEFDVFRVATSDSNYYFLGTAAMLTAERNHGRGIYSAALKGDFSFLD